MRAATRSPTRRRPSLPPCRERSRCDIDGREGRRALELALTVGRLVRERLQRFQ